MSDQESPDFLPEKPIEEPIEEPAENAAEPRPGPPVAQRVPRAAYGRRQHLGIPRLDVGKVIGSTFTIWLGNILPFSALALLIYSPIVIIGYVFFQRSPTEDDVIWFELTTGLAEMIFFSSLLTGTVTYGALMHLRGTRAPIGSCLTIGLSRLIHVFMVTLLVALACLACVVPAGVVLLTGNFAVSILLALVAIIPIVMITIAYHVAVPAVVVERVGILEALSRSAQLTKGCRLTILGILFIFGLLVGALSLPIGLVVGLAGTALEPSTSFLLENVFGALLAPLMAIIPSVIYHDLRISKEGANEKDLAAVFA